MKIALLLAILAIVTRAQLFGDPIADSDETFYLLVGERMLHGALPYVDIWDTKPVGLFLLYAAMRVLGGDGILAYQLVGTVVAWLTALLVARLAEEFTDPFGAAVAGAAYLIWLPLGFAAGGQAELFCNLPVCAAALLTLRGLQRPMPARIWLHGSLAMLLVGIALQIKYSALFAGIFFGCCWLVAAWRAGFRARIIAFALLLNFLALAPTLIVAASYAALGQFEPFVYANFLAIWQRVSTPPVYLLRRLAIIGLILLPLLACIRPFRGLRGDGRLAFAFTLMWLAAATAGLIAFGTYFPHYSLPLLLPVAAAAAPTLSRVPRWRAAALLGVAFLVGQTGLRIAHLWRGSRREVQAIVSAVDRRHCLFVYSGYAAFYRLADTCIPTKFAFPSHLSRDRDLNALGIDPLREVDRVMRTAPGTVIVSAPYRSAENWPARALVLTYIRQRYRLVLDQPLGIRHVAVYRLNAAQPIAVSRQAVRALSAANGSRTGPGSPASAPARNSRDSR
jgi:hypothetical protein